MSKHKITTTISCNNNSDYLKLAIKSVRQNCYYKDMPFIIHAENFNDGIGQWVTSGDWGLTNNPAYGAFALTDSPSGDYGSDQTTTAVLNEEFDFSFIVNQQINHYLEKVVERKLIIVVLKSLLI